MGSSPEPFPGSPVPQPAPAEASDVLTVTRASTHTCSCSQDAHLLAVTGLGSLATSLCSTPRALRANRCALVYPPRCSEQDARAPFLPPSPRAPPCCTHGFPARGPLRALAGGQSAQHRALAGVGDPGSGLGAGCRGGVALRLSATLPARCNPRACPCFQGEPAPAAQGSQNRADGPQVPARSSLQCPPRPRGEQSRASHPG